MRYSRAIRILLALLITAALLLAIFVFSSQEGEQTYAVSQGLLRTFIGRIVSHLPSLSPYGIEDDIRKYAHIAEFFLLSAAFFLLFFTSSFIRIYNIINIVIIAIEIIIILVIHIISIIVFVP